MATDLTDITVVCELIRQRDVNNFLDLGWKILEHSSGYSFEENIEFTDKIDKVGNFTFLLGWFGAKQDAKYPESYCKL